MKARRDSVLKYKKIITLIICVVLASVSATAATVAYFTDTSEDVNTFVFGDVKMTLDEAKVDSNGVPVGEERTTEGNAYHLIPGGSYTKDPTITIKKGTEGAYARLMVTVSAYSTVKEVFGSDFLPVNFVEGWDKNIWIYSGATEDTAANTVTYEFRYHEVVSAFSEDSKLEPLFKKLLLPGEKVDLEGVRKLADAGVSVSVIGNGIQSAGFENADEAWTAFEQQKQ